MVNIAPFNGVTYNFDKLDINNDFFELKKYKAQ